MKFLAVFQLVLLSLAALSARLVRADDWGWAPPPRHHRWRGALAQFGGAMVAGLGVHYLFKRRHNTKTVRAEQEQLLAIYKQELLEAVEEGLAKLDAQYAPRIRQLERKLHRTLDSEKQILKLLYALPDQNEDGLIDEQEFESYMAKYLDEHPALTREDLPDFSKMDQNGNGFITYPEWNQYMDEALFNLHAEDLMRGPDLDAIFNRQPTAQ